MTGTRSVWFLCLLLAGCATTDRQNPPAVDGGLAGGRGVPSQAPLPDARLTSRLLYDLLAAEVALQRGELAFAAEKYLTAAEATGDRRLAQRATRVAVYLRDYDKALAGSRIWVTGDPDDTDAHQTLAALLIQGGRAEEALPHLEKMLVMAGEDSSQGFNQVTALLSRAHDKQEALALANRLVEPRRADANALYAYAHLAFLLADHQRALTSVDEVLAKRDAWPQALILKANILRQTGRSAEAVANLAGAVDAMPRDASLRLSYARLLVEEKELVKAREQFVTLARQLPDNLDVHYALGLLALQAGDLDQAEQKFELLLESGQRRDEAAYSMAQVAEARNQPAQAIELYSAVQHGADNYLDSRLRIVALLNTAEGLEPAREYLATVQPESEEQQVRLYLAEGELLRGAGRHGEVKKLFDEALTHIADHPDLLYARAMVAERLGRIDLLEADLLRILSNDPENAQVLNALGYTLADRTDRYPEAFNYIQQALQHLPDDPAIMDSMGWVLHRLGRHDEALDYLNRAYEKFPDGEVAAHLGEVLWATGQRDDARRIWADALAREPDHERLREVTEKLR